MMKDEEHSVVANDEAVALLKRWLDKYTDLVRSGDCGFWDAEQEKEVIDTRAFLSKVK